MRESLRGAQPIHPASAGDSVRRPPDSLMLLLQRTAGNRATTRVLSRWTEREAALAIDRDVARILAIVRQTWVDDEDEQDLVRIFERHARVTGPHFEEFVLRLQTRGIWRGIVEQYRSGLDAALDALDGERLARVRRLLDRDTRVFRNYQVGEEITFGSSFAQDWRSGVIGEQIIGYFEGLGDAAIGFAESLVMLVTRPDDFVRGIANMPAAVSAFWSQREELWHAYLAAPPRQQARVIGRIVGEIELVLATAGGGGAGEAPQAGRALATVTTRGGAGAMAIASPLAAMGPAAAHTLQVVGHAAQTQSATRAVETTMRRVDSGGGGGSGTRGGGSGRGGGGSRRGGGGRGRGGGRRSQLPDPEDVERALTEIEQRRPAGRLTDVRAPIRFEQRVLEAMRAVRAAAGRRWLSASEFGTRVHAELARVLRADPASRGWTVLVEEPLGAGRGTETVRQWLRRTGDVDGLASELPTRVLDTRVADLRPDVVVRAPNGSMLVWDLTSTTRSQHLAKTTLYAKILAEDNVLMRIAETYWRAPSSP